MQMTDYHLFKTIAETGSFAAAAELMGKTPSGLSRRLTRLEDRLGHRLLERTTRSLKLTVKGEAFLDHCNRLVEAMARADAEIASAETELAGTLKIRIIAAYAARGFLPVLSAFQSRFPRITPWLLPEGSALHKEEADLIVSSTTASPGSGACVLEMNPWVICAAPSYLEQHGVPETPRDLLRHRCLVLDLAGKPQQQWMFRSNEQTFGLEVPPAMIAFGEAIHAAAREGLGVARLASFLIREDLENGKLVPLLTDFLGSSGRAICVSPTENSAHFAKVRAFLEFAASFDLNKTGRSSSRT
ncbi:LysR family transcriptional regulator [Roseibium sp. SCP14]|uniref:LysR family transcriptional regulator n=1 Tax=Roseibium sp. SCP14 TaxID=3141375 RepID=UPI00333B510A